MADEINGHVDVDNDASAKSKRNTMTTLIVGIVVLILVVAVTAVVVTNDDGPTLTTTTAPPSTDTTLSTVDQKVLADYRAFWGAYLEASDPMRPDHPSLASHSTGEQYAKLVNSFSGAKASNVVFRGTIDNRPIVTSIDGDKAFVRDCIGDSTGAYDATTGERQDASSNVRDLVEVALENIDNTWKVARLDKRGEGCEQP